MGFFDPREHPDKITFEIGGKEVPWLISKEALELASNEGIEPEDLEASTEDAIDEAMDALARLLYVGTLPFREAGEKTPELEDFSRVITPRTANRVGPKLKAQFEGIDDEQAKEVMGESGKG